MPSKKQIDFPVLCTYCGRTLYEDTHTWDHVIPRSQGGGSAPENLVHCCSPCNNRKGDLSVSEFLAGGQNGVCKKGRAKKRVIALLTAREPTVLGNISGNTQEGYTYTPQRGEGISPLLRQVLAAKGIRIIWLPLLQSIS